MRKEYSPWEFSGYAWAGIRTAIEKLDNEDTVSAREKLEDIIEQYHILNRVNGLKES